MIHFEFLHKNVYWDWTETLPGSNQTEVRTELWANSGREENSQQTAGHNVWSLPSAGHCHQQTEKLVQYNTNRLLFLTLYIYDLLNTWLFYFFFYL